MYAYRAAISGDIVGSAVNTKGDLRCVVLGQSIKRDCEVVATTPEGRDSIDCANLRSKSQTAHLKIK